MNKHLWNMRLAMEEAEKAFDLGEVPVGAIITDRQDRILARTHNLKEKNKNPCHHAEILAIGEASQKIGDWRLNGCILYTTLGPCIMCMGAIVASRIESLFFGAYDEKGGALSLGFNIHKNPKLNHKVAVVGGLLHYECSRQVSSFFKLRRKFY